MTIMPLTVLPNSLHAMETGLARSVTMRMGMRSGLGLARLLSLPRTERWRKPYQLAMTKLMRESAKVNVISEEGERKPMSSATA